MKEGEEEEEGFRVRGWGGLEHTQREEGKDKKKKNTHKSWAWLSATVASTLGEHTTPPLTAGGRGVALQDGCGSDVWSFLFTYMKTKRSIRRPNHAAVHPLSTIIHMHTHIHTHKGWLEYMELVRGGLLSHPFPCYCASWHAELSWCWPLLDVCFHAVTGEAGVNAILSFIGTAGLVLHWTLGPVVLIVGRFLRPTESPCNASLCTYRCKRSGQRRNWAKVCQWVTLNLTSASQKNFPVILIVWEQRIQVGRSWFRRPSNARALLEVCFHSENALLTLAVCLSVQGFRDMSEHEQLHSWRK